MPSAGGLGPVRARGLSPGHMGYGCSAASFHRACVFVSIVVEFWSHPFKAMARIIRLLSAATHTVATAAFFVYSRLAFRVKVEGLENFTRRPATVILINHKRDADGGVISTALCTGKGLLTTNLRINYAVRDDAFRRGFLAKYVMAGAPDWLRRPLRYVNVGPIIKLFRCHPVLFLPQRTVGDTLVDLKEAKSCRALEEVLRPDFLARLNGGYVRNGRSAASDVFRWPLWRSLQDLWSPRFYQRPALEELAGTLKAKLQQHMNALSGLLRQGETLFIAPEGEVSGSGSMGKLHYGTHKIMCHAGVETRLLPVFVTYDFMTTGRTTAFIGVGKEIEGVASLHARDFASLVSERLRSLGTITLGNLACAFLSRANGQAEGSMPLEELRNRLFALAGDLAGHGRCIDPRLLRRKSFERRFAAFVSFCRQKGLVAVKVGPDARAAGKPRQFLSWAPHPTLNYGSQEFEDFAPEYSFSPAITPA